ncbi:hypothetical protein, partial [Listeria monocytogenes]
DILETIQAVDTVFGKMVQDN